MECFIKKIFYILEINYIKQIRMKPISQNFQSSKKFITLHIIIRKRHYKKKADTQSSILIEV